LQSLENIFPIDVKPFEIPSLKIETSCSLLDMNASQHRRVITRSLCFDEKSPRGLFMITFLNLMPLKSSLSVWFLKIKKQAREREVNDDFIEEIKFSHGSKSHTSTACFPWNFHRSRSEHDTVVVVHIIKVFRECSERNFFFAPCREWEKSFGNSLWDVFE
jgi:hypothetical protein